MDGPIAYSVDVEEGMQYGVRPKAPHEFLQFCHTRVELVFPREVDKVAKVYSSWTASGQLG